MREREREAQEAPPPSKERRKGEEEGPECLLYLTVYYCVSYEDTTGYGSQPLSYLLHMNIYFISACV